MFTDLLHSLKTGVLMLLSLTLLTGVIYPLIVTGYAQLFFPWQANGSLISKDQQILGSRLIGLSFTSPRYFWGRPSATTPLPYNGAASQGANLGPSNPALLEQVKSRVLHLKNEAPLSNDLIPVDLVTTSASGLDPEISPQAAYYQAARIAQARKLPLKDVTTLIHAQISPRTWRLLGEPRVNVLVLNLALDNLGAQHGKRPTT